MLVLVCGTFGSGKTLLLAIMGIKVLDRDIDVYPNFHINDKRAKLLTIEVLLHLRRTKDGPRILVELDEAYVWLDSRVSASKLNRYLSHIILQSRKRGFDVVYAAQLPSSVDIRLRAMSDIIVLCERKPKGFRYTFVTESVWGKIRIMRRFLPWKTAEKYFDKYDTMEIVGESDMVFEKEKAKMWEKRMSELVKKVEKLEKQQGLKAVKLLLEKLMKQQPLNKSKSIPLMRSGEDPQ